VRLEVSKSANAADDNVVLLLITKPVEEERRLFPDATILEALASRLTLEAASGG
jgi:hypothetical protein